MASPIFKQTWTVMGVLLSMLAQGMLMSFPSIMLPVLTTPNSDIYLDLNTTSWFLSIIGTAGIPGFIFSSILMELYGRKIAHVIVLLPFIVGLLCTYYATDTAMLIIGRALGGISVAASISIGAVIVGEYTNPKDRGMFLNLKTAAVGFGKMTTHILGQFYVWRTVALISLIPSTIALLISCTWSESPSWLASKKKFEESEKSFYWLRGKDADSIKEIEELLRAQKEKLSTPSIKKSPIEIVKAFAKMLIRRDFILPITVVILSCILLEASGSNVFPTYALQIMEEITGDKDESFYYTLAIDIIVIISATLSSVITKYFKRRVILFSTGFPSIFVLYTSCIYLFLAGNNIISSERNYIAIILLCIFFILTNLGCTTMTGVLLGEIFPLAYRGLGSCISGIFFAAIIMSSMQITPYLFYSIKVCGTFAVYGTVMGITLIIMWFLLPETKDRTLQEIEDSLNGRRYKSITKYDDII